jgi:general secretion pathway protein C
MAIPSGDEASKYCAVHLCALQCVPDAEEGPEHRSMITSRRALILLYVVAAAFLIAHTINAVIAEALLVPSGIAVPPALPDAAASATRSPMSLAEHVRTSGLFPLPHAPAGTSAGISGLSGGVGAPAGVARQPLNLAAKLKLLGVVTGDRGGVSAIVEDLASKRQLFFRLHDQIPDIGEISEIRRNGIVLRQGDDEELLELSTGELTKPPVVQTASTGRSTVPPGGPIQKVLDRREVEQAMNDLPKLLSQARAVPHLVNGAMSGFRLDYIAPASFYEKIGLRYGDILKQVNGVEVRDPGTMLTLFQQLRNEQTVKLDVMRNNQRTTMTFDIR